MKNVKVKQDEEKEIPIEVIAASIVAISEGMKKLRAGRLNDRALELLIQHASPSMKYNQRVGVTEIRNVLIGLESLAETYLKKKETK